MTDRPLHYQVSEYDCVPTTFLNAIVYLFDRREVPPLVIRHIHTYSLDTVSPGGRLGRAGTSKYATQLLGYWLGNYKTRKFSVQTEYLTEKNVHLRKGNPILACLDEGGVALCNVYLGHGEWHYLLGLYHDATWLSFFDPYRRKLLRGLRSGARLLKSDEHPPANLAVRLDWLDQEDDRRYAFGSIEERECLLMRRVR